VTIHYHWDGLIKTAAKLFLQNEEEFRQPAK